MEDSKLIRGLDFSGSDNDINTQNNNNGEGTQINIINPYIQIVQQEEGLINDYNFRMSNLSREDALDRVKQLITLPDGYMTSKMVADYFDIPEVTLRSVIMRNEKELVSNGLIVLRGEELNQYKENFSSCIMQLQNTIPRNHLTLLTKRTVLNIAMLLRDSLVAKAIRYVILNVLETPIGQQLMLEEVNKLENRIKELEEELNEYKKNAEFELNNIKDTAKSSLVTTKLIQQGMEDMYKYNNNKTYDPNDPNLIDAVDKIVSKRFDVMHAYPYRLN